MKKSWKIEVFSFRKTGGFRKQGVSANRGCAKIEGIAGRYFENRGVMSHIWMSHVSHMNESCHTYE